MPVQMHLYDCDVGLIHMTLTAGNYKVAIRFSNVFVPIPLRFRDRDTLSQGNWI